MKPVTAQMAKQVLGLIYMAVRYDDRLPDPATGASSVAYSLPFSGAWTVLNGGVDEATSHSWDVYTQRYAYDFVVVGEDGLTYAGDPADVRSYRCYGLPVLAPADGEVVCARDADRDTPPAPEGGEPGCAGDDIRGNFESAPDPLTRGLPFRHDFRNGETEAEKWDIRRRSTRLSSSSRR